MFFIVVFIMVIGTILVGPCFGAKRRKIAIFMEIIGKEGILKMKGHKGPHFLTLKWWTHTSVL
jgi:hypothetical protein